MRTGIHLPIGRFSQLTRISVRSLRFYDETGLFSPQYTDPHTGYRYYLPEQFETAERIRQLRLLDLPLEDIRKILADPTSPEVSHILDQHRQTIERRMERDRHILDQLPLVKLQATPHRVEQVELAGQTLVAYSTVSGLRDIERYRLDAVERLSPLSRDPARMLYGIQHHLHEPDHLERTLHHQRVLNPRAFEVSFGMVCPPDQAVDLPLHLARLPAGTYLQTVHRGPYAPLHLAHQALLRHLRDQGLTPGKVVFECFEVAPWHTPDEASWVTRVCWQVG